MEHSGFPFSRIYTLFPSRISPSSRPVPRFSLYCSCNFTFTFFLNSWDQCVAPWRGSFSLPFLPAEARMVSGTSSPFHILSNIAKKKGWNFYKQLKSYVMFGKLGWLVYSVVIIVVRKNRQLEMLLVYHCIVNHSQRSMTAWTTALNMHVLAQIANVIHG